MDKLNARAMHSRTLRNKSLKRNWIEGLESRQLLSTALPTSAGISKTNSALVSDETVRAAQPAAVAGSLSGQQATAASSYNLTTLGTADWIHWGRGGLAGATDRKSSGGKQISDATVVGTGAVSGGYSQPTRDAIWTDGSPTASDPTERGYIWSNGALNTGYSFTVPAGTTAQTLYVYAGGNGVTSSLRAHLSDSSATDYVATATGSGVYSNFYTITFNAALVGQTLTITLLKTANVTGTNGSADLIAAALVGAPVAPPVDRTPPTATLTSAPSITTANTSVYKFDVTYTDNVMTDVYSVDSQDVLVTNYSGYSQLGTFSIARSTVNGPTVVATYYITPPAGGWTSAANGNYTFVLQANQVDDENGNYAVAGALGTFSVNIPTAGGNGSLGGQQAVAATSYNLTSLGTADWAHWGRSSAYGNFDHKASGGSQISNVTLTGTGSNVGGYGQAGRAVTWTDGSPTAADANETGYIWSNGSVNTGFVFTAPANTTTHTLYVYTGGFGISSSIRAHLSDGSAADYVATASGSGLYTDLYTITYKAASAGQTLTITLLKTGNITGTNGSVDLIGAALATAGVSTPTPAAPNIYQYSTNQSGFGTFTWQAVSGATTYNIYRSTTPGGEGSTPYVTGFTGTTFQDQTLSATTTYYFEVTTVNAGGESAKSNEVALVPQAVIPQAPVLDPATSSNGQVILDWGPVFGATDYGIYRSTTSGGSKTLLGTTLQPGFIESLTPGTTYYYTVTAANSAGSSPPSNEVAITVVGAPDVPDIYIAVANDESDNFQWASSNGARSFNIYRSTVSGGEGSSPIANTTSEGFADSNLVDGVTYYYQVTAVGPGGESAKSTELSLTPMAEPAYPPILNSATPGDKQVTLSWTPGVGVTNTYAVFRSTTPGGEGGTAIKSGITGTTYVDTSVTDGTTYYYKIQGTNSVASTNLSNELAVTPVSSTTPVAGSVTGTQTVAAASYKLTQLGTSDWAHWGDGTAYVADDRKATGGKQISEVKLVGPAPFVGVYHDASRSSTWTDGSPTASKTGDQNYIWSNAALYTGFSFTVPAGTTARTVYVYAGGNGVTSSVRAHLSDGSAADYVATASGTGIYTNLYAIKFKAASAGQTLTITLLKTANITGTQGSADLIAAALA